MIIAFLHDVERHFNGGAELSNAAIIAQAEALGYSVIYDDLTNFEETQSLVQRADITIVNNLVRCSYEMELIRYLLESSIPYVKWEHDYGLCAKRSLYCTVSPRMKNCCDSTRFKHYRDLYAKSVLNVFQSPMHYKYHAFFYGKAVTHHIILPPPIAVDAIANNWPKIKDQVLFLGHLNFVKGGYELIAYAEEHPHQNIVVYGDNRLKRRDLPKNIELRKKVSNTEAMAMLSRSEYFFFKPNMPEASGRVAAEAFLSGAKIISNDRVGTFSYDFYPESPYEAKQMMQQAPAFFWESVKNAMDNRPKQPSLKKVLVYKNYGGLGDRFIAIPAINRLKPVSEQVTVAVPPGLVNVFKRHTEGLEVIPMKNKDDVDMTVYDEVINLGNYPKSGRFDNEGVIDYPTHHKVRQHALKHYIDAIGTFHSDIDTSFKAYPYFTKETNMEAPYFTVHPGAGFEPKWWPTDRYVAVIQTLLQQLPKYRCVVILGPNDPDPKHFQLERVRIETGDLDAVELQLKGAQFHIGNDSGITHFSGVFNIPAVGIHGLTGPGSWSTMTSEKEIVWGKPGQCDLKCKYNVALNCTHRNCLTSISVERVLRAVYQLMQKSQIMEGSSVKYVFNPEVQLEKEANGFYLKTSEKELFLEFKEPEELILFETLVQEDLKASELPEGNFKQLLEAMVTEALVFAIPVL